MSSRSLEPPVAVAVDPARLERALTEADGAPVDRVETHGSWVFLSPTHAYKLKKPVHYDYADLRSRAARRRACEEEVTANGVLSGHLLYRLEGVLPAGDGGYRLGAPDDPEALETLVVTERFDEQETLAARIADGTARAQDLERVGATLAAFHRGATRRPRPEPVAALVLGNLGALAPLDGAPAAQVARLRRFAAAFLDAWDRVLYGREISGRVVDGHGDLRAEHVILGVDHVTVFDRLDLPDLRIVDVADDLAFLCMDLESLGAVHLVQPLLAGYVAAGGERPPRELVGFFAMHRACVRAKVRLLRLGQQEEPAGCDERAHGLLTLAERSAARARGDNVLVVTGPPAVGKSTVAAALGEVTGLPVLRSDEVRRRTGSDYSADGRTRVYTDLGRAAGRLPACIVDATFGEPAFRAAFLGGLDRDHRRRVFAVECLARPETLRRRARERIPGTTYGSQADAAVAARLAGAFTPFDALDPADRLTVDAEQPPAAVAEEIIGWLDRLLAAGRLV